MTNQCATPVRFATSAHIDILGIDVCTRTVRTPSPDIAVGAVRSCLTGIEATAIQHALLIVGPYFRIVQTGFQLFPALGLDILHLTTPIDGLAFAEHQIPPVAHLEHIRTFAHAFPHHIELSYVLPVLHISRLKVGKFRIAAIRRSRRDYHMIEAIVGHKYLWVTEVPGRIAIVRSMQLPEVVASPGLKVGRRSTHHNLAILAVGVLTSIVDVVQTLAFVVVAAACTQRSILLIVITSHGQYLAN